MSSSEKFKVEDAGSYDSFAEEFDQFDDIRRPVVETLFSRIELSRCERVLDVGTGTGIVALEAARRIEPNARIVGIDLSDGLLGSARRKNQFGQRVSFLKMDAENVGLKTGSFDAVLSLFALLHFPDPGRALGEMFRVLRSGGVATIAFGSGPPWLSLTGARHRIERIPDVMQLALGRLLIGPGFLDRLLRNMYPADSGGEETELARRSHVRGPHVVPLMHAAGFSAVSSYWRGYQYSFDDPERFWVLQRVYSSFSRKRLAALSAADRDAVKRAFMERCNRVLARRGRLVYPYAVMFVSGRKA